MANGRRLSPKASPSPMKIGVVSPTTIQFVEKMAALFPKGGVTVVGPPNRDQWGWNDYRKRTAEWEKAGLNITLDERPYERIPFSNFDVLIETFETLGMEESWRAACVRYECPVVVKACWSRTPHMLITNEYYAKIRNVPILLEMPAHVQHWEMAGMKDVNLVYNPVGQWWFDTPWTGEDERAVMVLSGKDQWRQLQHHGLDYLKRLEADFPGRIHLHDGMKDYKTAQEMAAMLAGARCFLALDEPYGQGERPLSLVFTEALSVGCPVAARDLPGLSYKELIDGNGVAVTDYEQLRDYVGRCLEDQAFAKACSARSKAIASDKFSLEVLQPRYLDIFERARTAFQRAVIALDAAPVMSKYARLEIE